MIKRHSIILAAAFFCSPVLAFAQAVPSPAFKACLDEAQSNVMGIKECSANEEVHLKKELAGVVKATASKVSKPRKKALSQAQAAWEKFHAANCDFYVDEGAGQTATMGAYQCSINMYNSRITELKTSLAQ